MHATIGITAGDPAGIGLEVVLKSISSVVTSARWILFTDRSIFERNAERFPSGIPFQWIRDTSELTDAPVLFLYDLDGDTSRIQFGERSSHAGARALAYLKAASDAALQGRIQAIVTAPVSKEAIGPGFHGQTDFFAEEAGCTRFAMAFFAPTFKVVLATIHLSLREALNKLSTERYVELIHFIDSQLKRLHFDRRRIAVAGVNPHAGEGGMFGREDIDVLSPAVRKCASEGIAV